MALHPEIGIGDFALNLIKKGKVTKGPSSAPVNPLAQPSIENQVDITNIRVPDSLTESILSQSFGITTKVNPKKPQVVEGRKKELRRDFNNTVTHLRELIEEMTTCGMIGTNVMRAKPLKKKKIKRGSTRHN